MNVIPRGRRALRALLCGAGLLCLGVQPCVVGAQPVIEDEDAHVVRILRTSNKAQINRYVGKVYDFQHVNPGAINNYFHSALFREEGAAFTFAAPDNASGKLLVICPDYQIPYFDKLAADLDRPELTSAPGSKYIYFQLKHRSAADPAFIDIARQYASGGGVVVGDTETNAVFCFDAPSGSDYLHRGVTEHLDQPTPVVDTAVRIYEVAVNSDGTLGLGYEDYKSGPYQGMLVGVANHSALDARSRINPTPGAVQRGRIHQTSRSTSLIVDLQYPAAYFDFLVQKGLARVVTDTRLVTSSARPAVLFSGEQVLYYARSENLETFSREVVGTTAPRAIPVELPNNRHDASGVVVEAIDAGVRLVYTPSVGERSITVDMDIALVSLLGFNGDGSPILNSRRASTAATIPDGGELVLGGLVRERQGRSAYKVPVLGSLPVIGWLFGGEKEVLQRTMLVIVVEPRIDRTFANMTARNQVTLAETTGDVAPEFPPAAWGFDMFLLDTE